MKKLSIYITVLLAAALTACNEDFNEGVASPQSYGQEEAADKITFTATGVAPSRSSAASDVYKRQDRKKLLTK